MITALRSLRPLLVRMALCVGAVLAVVGVCALFGLRFSLPFPIALGVVGGTLLWIHHAGIPRADHLSTPALDLDADYALPHAQDQRVRRLEDMIHGAQPRRRMTARSLSRILGEIADERAHGSAAPPLSADLSSRIIEARHPDADSHPVGPIDRRTLHRYLRELAAPPADRE